MCQSHAGEPSPVENFGGEPIDLESNDSGVYGCIVKFIWSKERRDGKLDANCGIGMYAGRSHTVPSGHRVIELVWNHSSKQLDLMPTVDANQSHSITPSTHTLCRSVLSFILEPS